MSSLLHTTIESPIGDLLLKSDGRHLTGIDFGPHPESATAEVPLELRPVAEQLRSYFAGELIAFDLTLAPAGTPFQRAVWAALDEIPYGETVGYGEIARRVGRPSAARAVGAACGRNPIPVVTPCHRVVGSSGALTGYAGGMERKRILLDLEARAAVPA